MKSKIERNQRTRTEWQAELEQFFGCCTAGKATAMHILEVFNAVAKRELLTRKALVA